MIRFLILLAATAALAHCQWLERQGTIEVRRYDPHGNVRNSTTGSFSLASTQNFFVIKSLNPLEENDTGVVVASDYTTVYQSQISYPPRSEGPSKSATTVPMAYGKFEPGCVPNGVESLAVIQGLALAQALTARFDTIVKDGRLEPSLIPRIVRRRAREDRMPDITSTAERLPQMGKIVAKFIASGVSGHTSAGPHPRTIELGSLEIDCGRDGGPSRILFAVNNFHGKVLSSATFDVERSERLSEAPTVPVAFEQGIKVGMSDVRFPEAPKLQYLLAPDETPPFANADNKTFQRIKQLVATVANHESSRQKRRQLVIAAGAIALVVLCGVVIRRFRK